MDVFISYSSLEAEEAYTVNGILQKNGITTWMAPGSIPPGSNYTIEIPKAIRNCTVFLLLLSEKAQNSIWVSAEVENAFKNGKIILPLQIEKCLLRDEFDFLLSRSQRIEAFEKKSDAMNNLVTIIKAIVGSKAPTVGSKTDYAGQIPKADSTPITAKPAAPASPKVPIADRFISEELEAKVRTANENSRRLKEKLRLFDEKDDEIRQKLVQFDVLSAEFDKKLQNFRLRDSLISKTPAETIKYDNGDVWSGNYDANGRKTGICTYKWTSGGEYHGDYLDGKRTGFGIQKWASGTVYEGEYLDACLDGIGRNTWNDGDVYLGLYKNDKRNGFGKYVWLSGSVYIGDYTENKRTGLGIETSADGTEYRGEFLDGKEEGLGKTSTKERVYTGDFKNGKKTGLGIFEWSNGDSLEGEYENNFLNGVGIYKWKSGTVYIGDYVKGKRTGLGRYIWSNGSRHDGHFEDGKRIGKGTYFLNDRIIDGIWKDDRIFEATEFDLEGNVVAEYKNGTRYPK